ncbi:MAG: ribbon-helix-helix domain-containing protein [Nitrososphaerales archaeon]|nr:ribbon-helix-helix domain-containing protein [Nitrososphaerales archaeon]
MAKEKVSIAVDKKVLDWIDAQVREDNYRNRSHAFEKAVKLLMEEKLSQSRA